jgi:threonine aldolase
MAAADVGDDGSGEDPTVAALEAEFARRVGKPAAVFVPSGTMANQIALRLLGRPGTRVIAGATQHVVGFELGAAGVNAPIQLHPVRDIDGHLDLEEVIFAIERAEHHGRAASAIAVENPHMYAGGIPWELDRLAAVAGLGLPVHLDGARLFNAEVATGVSAAAYAAHATLVTACLSKGLGAPVGSVLAGDEDAMDRARVERKRLGGGLRQAGVLAAPGLVALRDHVERLADDHARAKRLAESLADRWPGSVDPDRVRTNIVMCERPDWRDVLGHLEERGVLAGTVAPGRLRFVTHLDVDDEGIDVAVQAIAGF